MDKDQARNNYLLFVFDRNIICRRGNTDKLNIIFWWWKSVYLTGLRICYSIHNETIWNSIICFFWYKFLSSKRKRWFDYVWIFICCSLSIAKISFITVASYRRRYCRTTVGLQIKNKFIPKNSTRFINFYNYNLFIEVKLKTEYLSNCLRYVKL